ncbi:MAG: DUF4339 domain-containing protein, partial [Opitutae bacterium]|nr:DUF4339 domain-containing protein [Opitutae bacterium]
MLKKSKVAWVIGSILPASMLATIFTLLLPIPIYIFNFFYLFSKWKILGTKSLNKLTNSDNLIQDERVNTTNKPVDIWLRQEGVEYGPYTLEQVKEFVASGESVLEDEAWFDGCEDYLTVGDIPNFTSPRKIVRKGPRKRKVTPEEPRKKNPIVIASIVVSSVLVVAGLVVGGFYILKAEPREVDWDQVERRDGLMYFEAKPFTGVIVKKYPNGQKKDEITHEDGKVHGLSTRWHKNGQKKYEITHEDGKYHGLWTSWYDNG